MPGLWNVAAGTLDISDLHIAPLSDAEAKLLTDHRQALTGDCAEIVTNHNPRLLDVLLFSDGGVAAGRNFRHPADTVYLSPEVLCVPTPC